MSGPIFNQNHSGSGDNIINFGRQPFQLSQEFLDNLAARLDNSLPVNLTTAGNDQEKVAMGQYIAKFLVSRGFKVSPMHAYNLTNIPPLPKPLYVDGNSVTFDPT